MVDLRSFARQLRQIVLEESHRAHVGHIGSSLGIAELLAVLYGELLRAESPEDPGRDRFVLGKGHAALALYAALHLRGWLTRDELRGYCADGSLLGVHPEPHQRGVDFGTGSLGHALPLACGAALGARLQGSGRRVFALLSDAECNEGSVWEAAAFAAHQRLTQLVALIDDNGQQALGRTRDILHPASLAERWRGFGWTVREADGHEPGALREALSGLERLERPLVVVARTVLGKGVSFMEGQVKWHYWPMSEAEYAQAMAEVSGVGEVGG